MDLYALPPEEFTAARDEAAKADKGLKGLRRPTVSAWVVNTLVRRDPALLDQLLELGADLAAAQEGRDAATLRTLGERRRQLVAAVAQRAAELSGRDLTAAVREEVQGTLEAALADPPSAEAVRSGQLVRALSYAGFGGVDLDGAVAAGVPPITPTKAGSAKAKAGSARAKPARKEPAEVRPDKRIQKLEVAALEAHGALDDAVRLAERTTREQAAAAKALAETEQEDERAAAEVEQARKALTALEQEHATANSHRLAAAKAADALTRKVQRTAAAVAAAQQRSEQARQALDGARRG